MYELRCAVLAFVLLFSYEAIAGGEGMVKRQDWEPTASDLCSDYSEHFIHGNFDGELPQIASPAIANYVSTFNAYLDLQGDTGAALVSLFNYCLNHPALKLGDVTAEDVLKSMSSGFPKVQYQLELEEWFKSAVSVCGSDSGCIRTTTSYRNHARDCGLGVQQACIDRDRDLQDMNTWNARQQIQAYRRQQSSKTR